MFWVFCQDSERKAYLVTKLYLDMIILKKYGQLNKILVSQNYECF